MAFFLNSFRMVCAAIVLLSNCQEVFAQGSGQDLTRDEIFELQFRLNQLGYNVGEATGRMTSRTTKAAALFQSKQDGAKATAQSVLERARQAAAGVEGYTRADGQIDLLVFTDEGTAEILRVETWGLLQKSNSTTYLRGYDRDGTPLVNEHFDVRGMERRLDIRLEPWVSFGFKLHFPTPPRGERLEVEQTIIRPTLQADGSVVTTTNVIKNPFLKPPPPGPWYWYTGPEKDADPRLGGNWTMTLGQRGKTLLGRTFDLRPPAQ